MAPTKPYKIAVSDDQLKKLKQRLEIADFPSELTGVGWSYGTPLQRGADVKRLTAYWKDQFDWKSAEKKLNEIPQFTTEVQVEGFGTVDMHFLHQESGKAGIPLLFVHGWPGSFFEATNLLGVLRESSLGFNVVVPSLPNFGFSSRIDKAGFGIPQYAEACHKVMLALGYDEYVTQGGDWGHTITHALGLLYPTHCLASHTNFPFATPPADVDMSKLSTHETALLARAAKWQEDGAGYEQEQSTRPQTLAYGLRDPVALLAWIYEKLHDWTDSYPWTEDEVLTWISIYYFSRAGPEASVFIYYEVNHDKNYGEEMTATTPVKIPLALAYFPKELDAMPEAWVRKHAGDVKQVSYFEKGGHFAAWERPEDLAGDLLKFYGKDGPIASIIDRLTNRA